MNQLLLADVQNQADQRGVALERVGVTGLQYPLIVRQKDGGSQPVTAKIDLSVALHHQQRGAHLSHLVEVIEARRGWVLGVDEVVQLLREIRAGQDARGLALDRAEMSLEFKYFLSKAAPSSRLESLMPYDCRFEATLNGPGSKSLTVRVPVTTVCPCSLEISEVGAHNQRAEVNIQTWHDIEGGHRLWFEDLIDLAEGSASAGLHGLLKRRDEKAVTEQMFRTPRFVEDIVRDVVVGLSAWRGLRYRVRCESFESIHPHNAFAETCGAY